MSYKDVHNFILGADSDSDSRVIKGYRSAYNIRIGTSDSNHLACVENIKGNTLVNYALPPGTNKCIGCCEDLDNNALIYFIWNSNLQHLILRYNVIQNNITTILHQQIQGLWYFDLNFQHTKLITSCFVIQGLLYWTDGYNPPRKINIDKAIAYTQNVWTFTDNSWVAVTGTAAFVNPTVGVPSNITVGSKIIIQQFAGFTNASYNTVATVLAINGVAGTNSITTDIPWGVSTPPQGGQLILLSANNYSTINEQVIDRVKYPPLNSPTCSYQNDHTYSHNNLRGGTFQFAYAYIYDDKEQTVASPTSKLPIPQNEEYITGVYIENANANNRLDVVINTSEHNVNAILLYARSNAETSGSNPVTVSANYGNWYLVERIEKYKLDGTPIISNNIDYTYQFFNNKIKNTLDQSDIERLFDYVPQFCGASELIEKNRILDGNITEGYDNIDIDIDIDLIKNTVQKNGGSSITYNVSGFAWAGGTQYQYFPLPSQVQIGDIFDLYIVDQNNIYNTVSTSIADQAALNNYPASVVDALYSQLNHPNPLIFHIGEYTATSPAYLYFTFPSSIPQGQNYLQFYQLLQTSPILKFKSLKTGSYHQFGLIYSDRALRSGATNTNILNNVVGAATFYVPFPTEVAGGLAGLTISDAYQYLAQMTIKHTPPTWAKYCYIAYSGNLSLQSYLQYNCIALYATNGNIQINIQNQLTSFLADFPNCENSYVWQKGDRVRMLLRNATPTGVPVPNYNSWLYSSAYYDLEIISFDSASGNLICEPTSTPLGLMMDVYYSVVEVYTPKKNLGEQIFYEIGECLPIVSGYHTGSVQNQTASQPAIHLINSGDCYVKFRHTSNTASHVYAPPYDNFTYFPCESNSISDFYISDSTDKGRPNIVDRTQQQRHLKANYRWSGQLVQDTQINDLSRFDFLNSGQVPDKFGTIQRLVEVADVVKILQDKKCSSIYVGRSSTGEADSTNSLYVTSGVLGTLIVPAESFGTLNPESVCRWNRNLYFFDLLNGVYVRNSANGSFPISNYGQVNYFRTWKEQILYAQSRRGTSYVLSAYDKDTEQVIVTLGWNIPKYEFTKPISRYETIAFLESIEGEKTDFSDQWKTNYNFTPEYYGYCSTAFVAFQTGALWLQNSNNIHCNFFGKQYEETITFVVNIQPDAIKRLLAMAYDSNQRWYIKDINVLPTENYPMGQHSLILASKFVSKEGYFYAEFNKDDKDPRFINTLDALLNGRELRGKAIEITMGNQLTSEVILYEAYVALLPSAKSGAGK